MYKGCGAGRNWDISAGVGSKVRLRLRQVAEAVKMGRLYLNPQQWYPFLSRTGR